MEGHRPAIGAGEEGCPAMTPTEVDGLRHAAFTGTVRDLGKGHGRLVLGAAHDEADGVEGPILLGAVHVAPLLLTLLDRSTPQVLLLVVHTALKSVVAGQK